jgi:hypothetical protein
MKFIFRNQFKIDNKKENGGVAKHFRNNSWPK